MNNFHKDILNYESNLSRYAFKLTQNLEDSKDLVQDVLLRAILKESYFKKGTNLKAWLMTLTKNIFITSLRDKNRFDSKNTQSFEQIYEISLSKDNDTNLGISNLGVEFINKLIDDLTDRQRNSFLLRNKGCQYNQIAEILNIPLDSVKSNLHETKEILKNKLIKLGY